MYLSKITFLLLLRFLSVETSYQTPVRSWPLYHERPTVEIIQNTMVNNCPGFKGAAHPNLNYNGVRIPRNSPTTGSNVDVSVEGSPVLDDFTFTMFVKAASNEGTLFHYKATGEDDNTTDESFLDILLIYNSSFTSVVLLGQLGNVLGRVEFAIGSAAYMADWIGVAVSYDHSRQKVELMTQDGFKANDLIQGNLSVLKQPGRIRIGASFDHDNYPRFMGSIICATLYDEKLKQNDITDALNECLPSKWPSYEPNITCEQMGQHFEMIMKDSIVETSKLVIKKQTARSLVRCADLCQSEADYCFTFTFEKGTKLCRLYDEDHSLSIEPLVGVNYYRRKQNCC